jgi:hypothetical protein
LSVEGFFSMPKRQFLYSSRTSWSPMPVNNCEDESRFEAFDRRQRPLALTERWWLRIHSLIHDERYRMIGVPFIRMAFRR